LRIGELGALGFVFNVGLKRLADIAKVLLKFINERLVPAACFTLLNCLLEAFRFIHQASPLEILVDNVSAAGTL